MNRKIIENILEMISVVGGVEYSTECGSDYSSSECRDCSDYNTCTKQNKVQTLLKETKEMLEN
ncbi:MAG: hypothetical protein RR891_02615 [Clostridium sp.]